MHTPKIILLADDDLDDQELLEEAFLQLEENASIHTVSSGTELIEYLISCTKKEMPCLIILDYNMPNMNGAEVLEYLRKNESYSKIPAVVWSTSDSPVFKSICKERGAKYYFRKPNNVEEVTKIASQMLQVCEVKANT